VFGIRVGVSINLFVKTKQNPSETADIFYYRTDDLWNKNKKFDFLNESQHIGKIEWQTIQPNAEYTWLTEGLHAEFNNFIPIGSKEVKAGISTASDAIFKTFSRGVVTCRDAWTYNFNQDTLNGNVSRMIETYNSEVIQWSQQIIRDVKKIDEFVESDNTKISWSEALKRNLQRGKTTDFSQENVRTSLYRPFTKSNLYFDRMLTERVYVFPSVFPTPKTEEENRVICVNGIGGIKPFHALMVDIIPDFHLTGDSQCFPFYTYNEDGTNRQENITDWALAEFRKHYSDDTINK